MSCSIRQGANSAALAARFFLAFLHTFTRNHPPGTITISHGITATTTVINDAKLSDITDADSRAASAIGRNTRSLLSLSSRPESRFPPPLFPSRLPKSSAAQFRYPVALVSPPAFLGSAQRPPRSRHSALASFAVCRETP